MKHLRLLPIVVGLLLLSISIAWAQGAFSYTTGIQVQNLESADASVTLTFYKKDGTIDTTINDTITANNSKTYFPLGVSSGFDGSVIISSDKQIAAISNVLGNNGDAAASYIGASAGSTTVYLPLLMKNNSGFNTWFNVQNVGTADATVNVNYSDGTTAGPITIKPGAAHTFFQSTESHTKAVFSAVITSTQPIVAAVIEESSDVMFAYSGFASGSTNPVMPLINANNSGYITGVQIQNLGSSDTQVTVTYTPSAAGTACTETKTIKAGESETFALAAFSQTVSGENCADGATFVGSARVTANSTNQPLAVIVNQLLPGVNGEAYSGFDPAQATSKVVLPLIMDRNSGYWTGFNIMNVGTSATTVSCTFSGTSYTVNGTINAGEALTDLQNGKIGNNYVGSATCTASSGGKIVAVVNELGPDGSKDQLLVYEGISAQ